MTSLQLLKCDACEKSVPTTEVRGWYSVVELVGTTSEYRKRVAKAMQRGYSDALGGDFCSLKCLGQWAANAERLQGLEETEGED